MFRAPENSPVHVDADERLTRGLLQELSGLPLVDVPGDPDGLLARAARPDLGGWLAHAARARGCAHPVRLRGEVLTVQASTGVVLQRFNTDDLPDKVLYKPCGTRLASRCPACAEVYRWDTYQLVKAGLAGGKGVPETVATHPAVFATFTAPSFGLVHTRDARSPKPCRPRRDRPVCPHGKPLSCMALHAENDPRLGQPLCLDCYDHTHHVVWNHLVGKLWDRTMLRLRRATGATGAGPIRLRFAKVAEYQRRGVVHLHALIRIDGHDPNDPDAFLPPPVAVAPDGSTIPLYSAARLAETVKTVAAELALRTQAHPANADGWVIAWGHKGIDAKVVRTGLPGGELTEQHVAGYLAKYATKATEVCGVTAGRITSETIAAYGDRARHTNRLILASWDLGAYVEWMGLRRWAHRLGFAGHFSTKSRRYSTTLTALRRARRPQNRIQVTAIDEQDPAELTEDLHDDETTLVINHWQYVGNGWQTTGDAALAAMAADAARQRRPASSAGTNQT
ncbi:replication initiator [Allorhizocola rhizosphaerae]|uniref:replication initiator n=1 Tax=Allorhizocola rhizosphaerae TaxID=1872709 RepID=UPI001FE99478|nr:replication initiator [Allorhizocola rhizosphaerae]